MSMAKVSQSKADVRERPGGRTAQTANRVRQATIDLLVEGGLQAVTYQEVAKRAEVGRATVYRRWGNVASLVGFAVTETAAQNVVIKDKGSIKADLFFVLQQIGEFVSSPIGTAALAARLSVPRTALGEATGGTYWSTRAEDIRYVFQRAKERGEIRSDLDAEVEFAKLAGAIYFRLIVMEEAADKSWIEQVLADY